MNRRRNLAFVKRMVFFILIGFIVLLPVTYLAEIIQETIDWPVFFIRILVSVLWAVILYIIFWAPHFIVHKYRKNDKPHNNIYESALDALDRISQGDYSVYISQDEGYYFNYNELGNKINKLAKQLFSMEQMRQEFVSSVSHEIRSPLTSISGFAKLLRKPELTDKERNYYIDIIQRETERMSKLSDNLLRLSMLDKNERDINIETFRVDKQIKDILLAQEPQWSSKGIDLDINLSKIIYNGDEDLLFQVWQNLIQNAIKFTPEGGKIHIRLEEKEGYIEFVVKDSGIGISKNDLMHIFERFYKADKARNREINGNGLGLSIVKSIIEIHNGKINVESEENKGTEFTVTLPICFNQEQLN